MKNFRLTVPKNFVEEPDCVSENFGSRKTLCLGGEYHDFLLKICLTIPKNFVGEPFFVSRNLWYRKNLWIRRGGGLYHGFQSKFFYHSAEKFRSGTLSDPCFRKSPVAKKFMDKRGGYQDFPSKIFCLTVRKNFMGEPFCAVSENFW